MTIEFFLPIFSLVAGLYFIYTSLRNLFSREYYLLKTKRNIRWQINKSAKEINDEITSLEKDTDEGEFFSRYGWGITNLVFGIALLYIFFSLLL